MIPLETVKNKKKRKSPNYSPPPHVSEREGGRESIILQKYSEFFIIIFR